MGNAFPFFKGLQSFWNSDAVNLQNFDKFINLLPEDSSEREVYLALLDAVENENECMIDSLISRGCQIDVKNKTGIGVLPLTCAFGQLKMTKKLVESGLDINETYTGGYTSLHWAAIKAEACHWGQKNDSFGVADFLLSQGANIEVQAGQGGTPFLVAVMHGNEEMADFLLSKGCNINAKNFLGNGALALAIVNGRFQMTEKLIKLGMKMNETHRCGWASLHFAARFGHADIASLLLKNGADIEAKDKWGRSPFLAAVSTGHTNVIEVLDANQCSFWAKSYEGTSALGWACKNGHIHIAKLLLSRGFNVNETDQYGCTSLHVSAQNGFDQLAAFLLENNASLEAQDTWGCTPFLTAVEFGQDNVIDVLIRNCCNVFARMKTGECALDLAVAGGRLDLVKRFAMNELEDEQLAEQTRRFLGALCDKRNRIAIDYVRELCVLLSLKSSDFFENIPVEVEDGCSSPFDLVACELKEIQTEGSELCESLQRAEKSFSGDGNEIQQMQLVAQSLTRRAKNAEDHHAESVEARIERERSLEEEKSSISKLLAEKEDECFQLLEERDQLIDQLQKRTNMAEERERTLNAEKKEMSRLYDQIFEELLEEKNQLSDQVLALTRVAEERKRSLQEYEDLMQIPSVQVEMTDVKLGGGAYGEVIVGSWRGCKVAVKKFYEAIASDYNIGLFKQEIGICCRVRHPNIVSLFGVTTENGIPLQMITELMEGSLSDVIKAASRSSRLLSLREKVDLAIGSSAGIAYLHQFGRHQKGVLHGDIRSSNIVVSALMVAKICDLGAARFAEVSKMVSVGPLSPDYLAPERKTDTRERPPNTKVADIYSWGATLIELMTGHMAAATLRYSHVSEVDQPQVKRLCLGSIESSPEKRPAAREFVAVLERVSLSEEYKECPPKRMVKGKLHGESCLQLVDGPWAGSPQGSA